MARLYTTGAELGHVQAEGLTATGAGATVQASSARTGSRRYQTTGAASTYLSRTFAHVADRLYWLRAYVAFSALNPGANPSLIIGTIAGQWVEARLSLVGGQPAISLHSAGNNGGVSWVFGAALSANTYYRFELNYRYSATAGQQLAELKIWDTDDSTLLQTLTLPTPVLTGTPTAVFLGHDSGTAPTTAITLSFDDVAINDATPSFPYGPEYSNFDASDANPLPGTTTMPFYGNALQRIQSGVSGTAAGICGARLDGSTAGPDCELSVEVRTEPTNNTERIDLIVRGSGLTGATPTFYRLRWIKAGVGGVDSFQIDKIIAGVVTNIGAAVARATANGDTIGVRAVGNRISALHLNTAGVVAEVLAATDSAITTAGEAGLAIEGTAARLDNARYGTIPSTAAARSEDGPGAGKVYYLLPTAVDAGSAASWAKPGGSTTDRHTSIDNVPPVFEAIDNVVGEAESFLRNATNTANLDLLVDVQQYDAVIPSGDAIRLVQPVITTGQNNATDTTGTIRSTHPAIGAINFAGYPAGGNSFDNAIASATATTFPNHRGNVVYGPDPTRTLAPRITIRRGTASTRVSVVNSVAMIVEAEPSSNPPITASGTNELDVDNDGSGAIVGTTVVNELDLDDSGTGAIASSATNELDLDDSGTGVVVTVADGTNELDLDDSGSGAIAVTTGNDLVLDAAGSGAITDDGTNELDLDDSGTGIVVTVAAATDELVLEVSGTAVVILGGNATVELDLDADGTGAIASSGTNELDLDDSGQGSHVREAVNDLDLDADGSGAIRVTSTNELVLDAAGSGAITDDGTNELDLDADGTGVVGVGPIGGSGTNELVLEAIGDASVTGVAIVNTSSRPRLRLGNIGRDLVFVEGRGAPVVEPVRPRPLPITAEAELELMLEAIGDARVYGDSTDDELELLEVLSLL